MPSPITVTASLTDASSTALQGSAFVRFRLRGFSGFVPRVSGTSVICETQIDALPSGAGAISQTLWKNSDITPSSTFWTVEFWDLGRITSSGNYIFNANTDLGTAAQINTPPVPAGFSLLLENNSVLNSSQSTLNLVNSDGSVVITDLGAGNIRLNAATAAKGPRPLSGDWNFGKLTASGLVFSQIGTSITTFQFGSPTNSFNAATATEPPSQLLLNSGGSAVSAFCDAWFNIALGTFTDFQQRIQPKSGTNTSHWIGMTDTTTGNYVTVFAVQNPVSNFVGFRRSTDAGDTTWKAYTSRDATHFTVVDTGVAFDTTASHVFEVQQLTAGTLTFLIDGVACGTISTAANMPATSTNLGLISLVAQASATATAFNIAGSWWYWESSR